MGFNEFQWVLLGFDGFQLVSLGSTGFLWVSIGFIGFYWVSIGFRWVLLGFTGFQKVSPSVTGFLQVFVGSHGLNRVSTSLTAWCCVLLGFTGFLLDWAESWCAGERKEAWNLGADRWHGRPEIRRSRWFELAASRLADVGLTSERRSYRSAPSKTINPPPPFPSVSAVSHFRSSSRH